MKLLLLTLFLSLCLQASTYKEAYKLYENSEFEKAFIIFKQLAENDSDAAHMLAYMYENGKGCEIDKNKASEWYKISSINYFKQTKHNNIREIEKEKIKLYKSLARLDDIESEDTIKQYTQSLYNFKAHNANYFLPLSYRSKGQYADTYGHSAKETETEFQFSVKFDVASNLLKLNEIYSIAYTQKSFWQVYSTSAFFRESNYNPEFFITIPTSEIDDGRLIKAVRLTLAHESNGKGGVEERSWNYFSGSLFFQYKSLFAELKLWKRLPDPFDYNPNLTDYLGHGYVKFMLPYKKHFFDLKLRHGTNSKGAFEINHTYPLFSRDDMFLYTKFFNGYGESLIDYDNHIKKFGIGFSISR